jgi:hypothetical protein
MLRLRDALIVTQIALTATLLAGSALLAQSIAALLHVELGFQARQSPRCGWRLRPAVHRGRSPAALFDQLLETEERPVRRPGAVSQLPLPGGTPPFAEGETSASLERREVITGRSRRLLQTLQVPIQSGRFLNRDDNGTSRQRISSTSTANLRNGRGGRETDPLVCLPTTTEVPVCEGHPTGP